MMLFWIENKYCYEFGKIQIIYILTFRNSDFKAFEKIPFHAVKLINQSIKETIIDL